MNLGLIFLTGLTTGGLSCVAVQGGLLTSMIANQKSDGKHKPSKVSKIAGIELLQDDLLSLGMFLITKLFAYTIIGFLLGLLGSVLTLNLTTRLVFQVFTALFMLGTAMNLLQVHPIFRYLSFQPPRFVGRFIKDASKSRAVFAPGILGLLTIFIPCGVTQAMEVLAINTGSPVQGAVIMFAFVLGTIPLFSLIGFILTKISSSWRGLFNKVAAYSLIGIALYSLNGVAVVLDSPLSFQHIVGGIASNFPSTVNGNAVITNQNEGVQKVTIGIFNNGYSPKDISVKQNIPVELTLVSKDAYSCALSFVLKEFGISTFLKSTDSKTFTFTPTKKGNFTFACSMGMYSGTLRVI